MRVLITGAHGQVGTELSKQAGQLGWETHSVDIDGLDITDIEAVNSIICEYEPDAVINAAAYTAVDRAESDEMAAYAVNRDGPKNLARACGELDISLVHYSTDYVFDGSKSGAYTEDDQVAPLGMYGKSKFAGEEAVRRHCDRHLILRTSWVFSTQGNNFVKTMLRLGREHEELGVVSDQFGKPTSEAEIARITLQILSGYQKDWGTYHLAQPAMTSWHGFAKAIFKQAEALGEPLKLNRLNAIATSDYPTAAKRPANSELSCDRLEAVFGVRIRPWRDSLYDVIKELSSG